ncbi:MAG: TonB family protein [Steroidobacteraceae bacterium]
MRGPIELTQRECNKVPKAAMMHEPTSGVSSEPVSASNPHRQKQAAFLVTPDDSLWVQIGGIGNDWIVKQLDSIDDLVAETQPGQSGIILWDARGCPQQADILSRIQLHSDRFAIVALDVPADVGAWTLPLQQRQVVATLSVPIDPRQLTEALTRGLEEIHARVALLGEASAGASATATATAPSPPPPGRRFPWAATAIAVAALGALAAAVLLLRHADRPVPAKPELGAAREQPALDKTSGAVADTMDILIERGEQAMADRHYIDPAEGSALVLYRGALILDPSNGEARQGLARLAQVLFARVQTALDERKFDAALQALETARSISPDDPQLAALDARIAAVRIEFGPAQIQAAINAQNFDHATELIDEAATAKLLSGAKLNQLRDEVRLQRGQFAAGHYAALVGARLQQDRLTDPPNDSAAAYLRQARQEGVTSPALEFKYQEFVDRVSQAVRGAVEQRRFADADRLLAELRNSGAPGTTTAALQKSLDNARGQPAHAKLDQTLPPPADSAGPPAQARAPDERVAPAQAADADAKSAAAAGAMPEMSENLLVRVSPLKPQYPAEALTRGVEGWVELGYTVTAAGKVVDVKTLNADPVGVFEAAAWAAVLRVRYQPVQRDGKAIAVATRVRVTFRMSAG